MRKIIIFMLLLSFVLVGCKDVEVGEFQPGEYQLTEKNEEYEDDATTAMLSYPVIGGFDKKEIEDKINNTLSERIQLYKEISGFGLGMGFDETTNIWYETTYNSKELLSLKFYLESELSEDTKDLIIDTFTFDLNTGEVLELDNLFKNKQYKKTLNSKIKKEFDELDIETLREFKEMDENQGYYLNGSNLVICFQALDYTKDEPLEFEIPFGDINNLLKNPIPNQE